MSDAQSHLPGHDAVQGFLRRTHGLLIGGKWLPSRSGKTFSVSNPATGKVISHVADASPDDVDIAVVAAREALSGPWAKMLSSERAKLLWKVGDLIEAHTDELALLETLDNGKTLSSARKVDVPDAADRFRYFSGWATKIAGNTLSSQGPESWHAYTMREPVGVAGLIVAWNFPLFQAANKISAALAAGCTVILKPAEQTPLSALRLGELIEEAGIPPGVVNILTGFGATAGAAISTHAGIDKVSFTGSTAVGKLVLDAARGNLKRVTLELGGKSPVIIFPDADLERAIAAAANGIFFNSGQVCSAGSSLFAHQSIFEAVVDGLVRHAQKLNIGPGIRPETDLGPLVSDVQLERVNRYCRGAEAAGARILTGGRIIPREGYYFAPSVIAGTRGDMAVRQEEVFGPVLCVTPFSGTDIDAVANAANETIYGLAAYVWTRDLSVAHRIARKLKAGIVSINGGRRDSSVPSGGYKQSGWGREHGLIGLEEFTEHKSVVINL